MCFETIRSHCRNDKCTDLELCTALRYGDNVTEKSSYIPDSRKENKGRFKEERRQDKDEMSHTTTISNSPKILSCDCEIRIVLEDKTKTHAGNLIPVPKQWCFFFYNKNIYRLGLLMSYCINVSGGVHECTRYNAPMH